MAIIGQQLGLNWFPTVSYRLLTLFILIVLQSLELWNLAENKCMTIAAHDCVIASLAQSPLTGMVASASHDKSVKIWK